MNTEEVLDKAINIIQEGWCQGDYSSRDGKSFCMLGSFYRATGVGLDESGLLDLANMTNDQERDYRGAKQAVEEALRQENIPAFIPDFNDHIAKSAEDVLLIMKKAKENVSD